MYMLADCALALLSEFRWPVFLIDLMWFFPKVPQQVYGLLPPTGCSSSPGHYLFPSSTSCPSTSALFPIRVPLPAFLRTPSAINFHESTEQLLSFSPTLNIQSMLWLFYGTSFTTCHVALQYHHLIISFIFFIRLHTPWSLFDCIFCME